MPCHPTNWWTGCWPASIEMTPRLVLLASYPKSGNTWLRLVLSALLSDDGAPPPINAIGCGNYGTRRQLFDLHAPWPSSDLGDDELEQFWPDVYRQFNAHSAGVEFLKVHSGAWRTRGTEWLFPPETVREVLHLVRHPFDVAVSFAHHLRSTPARAVKVMTSSAYTSMARADRLHPNLPERYGSWAEHGRSWASPGVPYRVVRVRYEDLLANPEAAFGLLAEAAGLQFTRARLARAVELTRFERLRDEEQREGFRERPHHDRNFFRAGRAGAWQEQLEPALRERLLADCASAMSMFGYTSDGLVA